MLVAIRRCREFSKRHLRVSIGRLVRAPFSTKRNSFKIEQLSVTMRTRTRCLCILHHDAKSGSIGGRNCLKSGYYIRRIHAKYGFGQPEIET